MMPIDDQTPEQQPEPDVSPEVAESAASPIENVGEPAASVDGAVPYEQAISVTVEDGEPRVMLYGQPIVDLPQDLYIPPDALSVMLDAFEGPLDLLLYLIRKANVDILDIPMATLTVQYLDYVEVMRAQNLELAAEYLVMAAMLIEIKSRMLLPRPKAEFEEEVEETVIALLELCKEHLLEMTQTAAFAPIYVRLPTDAPEQSMFEVPEADDLPEEDESV